jgi:hypothetical protein
MLIFHRMQPVDWRGLGFAHERRAAEVTMIGLPAKRRTTNKK